LEIKKKQPEKEKPRSILADGIGAVFNLGRKNKMKIITTAAKGNSGFELTQDEMRLIKMMRQCPERDFIMDFAQNMALSSLKNAPKPALRLVAGGAA